VIGLVKKSYTREYRCPYCSNFSSWDEDTVEEHIIDNHMEEPIWWTCEHYECEMCNKVYEDISDAQECEEKHKEYDDMHYNGYLDEINKQKLLEAANAPGQRRLI
jgi:hypothetical protein